MRPIVGGESWPQYLVALTETALTIILPLEEGEHFKIEEEHVLRPDCTVKLTTLKEYSFQFTTVNRILHFAVESEEQLDFWMTALSEAIKTCSPTVEIDNSSEVLYRESLMKIQQDVFYDITFSEKKPLVRVRVN